MGVRTTTPAGYECGACGTRVPPMAYRARCPRCGGRLRAATGA